MKKKSKAVFALLLFALLILAFAYKTDKVFESYGETALKNAVYTRVNSEIRLFIKENIELFDDLVEHEYADDGTIAAMKMNTAKLGILQSGLESEILKAVSNLNTQGFEVPLGNLTGSKLLSGRGPNIKIETVPLNTLNCDTVNKFESVGINQTLHKIDLVFNVNFKASAPFADTEFENTFTITLCESIIIGKVPEVYLN